MQNLRGARSDVLEQITHNARGAIIDVYTAWQWPALCEAVSCLNVDPERLPGRIYDISYDICVLTCPVSSPAVPPILGPRKSNKALTLALTPDVVDAIRWHIREGYAGDEFLFSGTAPSQFTSTATSARSAPCSGHSAYASSPITKIGRHSVASQAATGGQSIKAIQAQLGHRSAQSTEIYAHLGAQAQLRLVEALRPLAPPHVNVRSTGSDHQDR